MPHAPSDHKRFSTRLRVGLVIACVLAPLAAANAYVGPGAGLSLLSALWGLLCAIGAAFLFVIMWPIRRMRRRKRESQQGQQSAQNRQGSDSQQRPSANRNTGEESGPGA